MSDKLRKIIWECWPKYYVNYSSATPINDFKSRMAHEGLEKAAEEFIAKEGVEKMLELGARYDAIGARLAMEAMK